MSTMTRLSQRQDLLEGIHAEGVLCYLKRHGVLDPVVVASLGEKATTRQINSTILRHVERQGQEALWLLINALRQSWQLQLASSLDPEPRIQPAPGNSYAGKHRHRGQLTIRIQMEALRVNAQENARVTTADANMCQDLTFADTDYTLNVSHLCENMTPELTVSPGLNTTSRSDKVDGASLKDEEDEDFVKPKSCWSFCLFRKKKSKKDSGKQKTAGKMGTSASKVNLSFSQSASEKKSQRKKLKEKPSNGKLILSKSDILERIYIENNNGLYNNQLDDSRSLSQLHIRFGGDETADVKPGCGGCEMIRSDQLDSSLGLRDSRRHNVEHFHNLLHQTSADKDFEHQAAELYAKITDELQTEIIKYFEQELGVLVLEVAAQDAAIDVVCICMTRSHVKSLQQAVNGGGLLTKIKGMLAQVDTAMFGSQEVKLKIAVDDNEMCTVVGELS